MAGDCMIFGVNYQGASDFDPAKLTDEVMAQNFALFASQGIDHIIVIAYWNSLEPTAGSYNTTYVNNLKRFIKAAKLAGMNVSIDTHCHMTGTNLPVWVGQGGNGQRNMSNIFYYALVLERFLALHEWLAQQLVGDYQVYSMQAWNEPYPVSGETTDQFLDIFEQIRAKWIAHNAAPFTIRTAIPQVVWFTNSPEDADRFFAVCDYVNINFYPNKYAGHTFANLLTALTRIDAEPKDWMFGEFGYSSSNDTTQYNGMLAAITDTTEEITDAGNSMPLWNNIWIWCDANPEAIGYWNVCNTDNSPRPAFALIVSDEGGGGGEGSDEILTVTLSENLPDFIDEDGYVWLLVRTTNPSNGATPAVLYCDFVQCMFQVYGLSHVDVISYRNVEMTEVKPYLYRCEFLLRGWLFESLSGVF